MGMGVGGIQPLVAQLKEQGAFDSPYVSPALTAQPATPQQGPTPQGGYNSSGNQNMNQLMNTAPMGSGSPLSSLRNIDPNGVMGGERKPIPQATAEQQRLMQDSAPQGGFGTLSSLLSGNGPGQIPIQQPTAAYPSAHSSSNSINSTPNPGSFSGASLYGGGSSQGSAGFNGGSGGPFPLQGQYGIVKMAEGGLAGAAQNMANKGRDGDSMLVHMSPGEVKGLQALAMAHGGSLSINPDTGLVEASFLKRILPMVAGAGLMMIPGVNALAAAGMVGGFETLRTGDIGKGLMAGLGAYGGAGLAGNLSKAAASTAVDESARNLANQAIAEGSTTAGMAEATRNIGTPTLSSIGQGAKQVFSSPEALGTFGKQNLMNIGAAAAPALGDAMTPKGPPIPGQPEEDPRYAGSPYRYNLAPGFQGSTPVRPSPYYRPTGLGYAEGGDVMMAAGGSFDDEPMGDDVAMAAGGIAGYKAGGLKIGEGIARDTDTDTASLGAYDAAMKRLEKQHSAANLKARAMPKTNMSRLGEIKTGIAAAAQGGSIGGYSDGGRMLKGPGDGMSDSIPATIGKRQPARLADGEFVVPADVVSHLGNGSTDAGARKLYSMMDKIRKARTGKKKQAPAVKASKYMPA